MLFRKLIFNFCSNDSMPQRDGKVYIYGMLLKLMMLVMMVLVLVLFMYPYNVVVVVFDFIVVFVAALEQVFLYHLIVNET